MKQKKRPSLLAGGPRNIILATFVLLGFLVVLHRLIDSTRNVQQLTYSAFLDKVEANEVRAVRYYGQDLEG